MVLEGVVTNVAAFGAFVDVGVHQDGLVHVSAMSRDFVSDPRQVAKPGDVVRVRVVSVDIPRQRISLTMRLDEERPRGGQAPRESQPARRGRDKPGRGRAEPRTPAGGAMADALRRAGLPEPGSVTATTPAAERPHEGLPGLGG